VAKTAVSKKKVSPRAAATAKPTQATKTAVPRSPGRKDRAPVTPTPAAAPAREAKIQAALYRIADAASAVKDMQEFYAEMHRIVGELMYAENFFIALHDKTTGLRCSLSMPRANLTRA
jgi:hypothetical protein